MIKKRLRFRALRPASGKPLQLTCGLVFAVFAQAKPLDLPYHPPIEGALVIQPQGCERVEDEKTQWWRECTAGLRLENERLGTLPNGHSVKWVKISPWLSAKASVKGQTKQAGPHLTIPMECYEHSFPLFSMWASRVNFNNDRFPDYVIGSSCGGMGLMGWMQEVWLLLSDAKGNYHAVQFFHLDDILTWLPAQAGQPAQVLQRGFAGTDKVYAAPNRNYWIYWRWQIQGTQLKPAPQAPVWMRFTDQPHNKPNTTITAKQRAAILNHGPWWSLNKPPKAYP